MSNPVRIDLEVSQTLSRDGTRGPENWNILISDNEGIDRFEVEEAQRAELLTKSNVEIVNFANSFDSSIMSYALDYEDGVHIFGEYVDFASLENAAPKA